MKRIERKHLKEDELAHTLRVAREFVAPRQQLLKQVGLAAIVVLVIVVAYGFWRERTDSRGQKELAEAKQGSEALLADARQKAVA